MSQFQQIITRYINQLGMGEIIAITILVGLIIFVIIYQSKFQSTRREYREDYTDNYSSSSSTPTYENSPTDKESEFKVWLFIDGVSIIILLLTIRVVFSRALMMFGMSMPIVWIGSTILFYYLVIKKILFNTHQK